MSFGILRAHPHNSFLFDWRTLKVLEVNDEAVARLGWSRRELTRMKVLDLVPPEDLSRVRLPLEPRLKALRDHPARLLRKDGARLEVEVSLHTVRQGGRACGVVVARARPEPRTDAGLTARERDVLRLLAGGLTSRMIAASLGIGVRTVETHRARLLSKLGARSAPALVLAALQAGLLPARP